MDLYGHLYPDEMDTWAARLNDVATQSKVCPIRGQNADPRGDDEKEDL